MERKNTSSNPYPAAPQSVARPAFDLTRKMKKKLQRLDKTLQGEVRFDAVARLSYATDASVYREKPLAVAVVRGADDLQTLMHFAKRENIPLIPRTAGTSLAGQVVGRGIVVDCSLMREVLEINVRERWVRVQPGVVRELLNNALKPHGFLFGPETATANRAMLGGMIGNNSCGANSLVYGSTRDNLISVKVILSDGSRTTFAALSPQALEAKSQAEPACLADEIHQTLYGLLKNKKNQAAIKKQFPPPQVKRRNTGYALDALLNTSAFKEKNKPPTSTGDFNLAQLIAGAEGTLALVYEAKLKIHPLPPPHQGLLCAHFSSLHQCLRAAQLAEQFSPSASELIDHFILESTKRNLSQQENRFFVKADAAGREPQAILVLELTEKSETALKRRLGQLKRKLQEKKLGYHYPFLLGEKRAAVWNLRKAGLGLLSNLPGDGKPVAVVEDTAVELAKLADYIKEFDALMQRLGLSSVHYAHAGAGELHLRPVLNLKTHSGQALFVKVAERVARLVKRYRGSLSGEHGDGRLRAQFIPLLLGKTNHRMLQQVKHLFDPQNLLNPGKIVAAPPLTEGLRYAAGQTTRTVDTYFDFSDTKGLVRAAEQCNGSGDCRKTLSAGGVMCPSYMASLEEDKTTRARANVLREVMTHSKKVNPFEAQELEEVMRYCLSCKACKRECPSNVDVTKLKAESEAQRYKTQRPPLKTRLFLWFFSLAPVFSRFSGMVNYCLRRRWLSLPLRWGLGLSLRRSLPTFSAVSLTRWQQKRARQWKKHPETKPPVGRGRVHFFKDEFSDYYDSALAQKAVLLLEALGYEVRFPKHAPSARSYLSKGFLRQAKAQLRSNVAALAPVITEAAPLVGLEPSALLTFRDEAIALAHTAEEKRRAVALAKNTLLLDEFIARELEAGRIRPEQFRRGEQVMHLHGHCYQKALASLGPSVRALSLVSRRVKVVAASCCGMAGSFGLERETEALSLKIGELALFPLARALPAGEVIVANGTSCRHQLLDGENYRAKHMAEVLYAGLKRAAA